LEVNRFLIILRAMHREGLKALDLVQTLLHLRNFSSSSIKPNLLSFPCLEKEALGNNSPQNGDFTLLFKSTNEGELTPNFNGSFKLNLSSTDNRSKPERPASGLFGTSMNLLVSE
jgi:hypothetical protein